MMGTVWLQQWNKCKEKESKWKYIMVLPVTELEGQEGGWWCSLLLLQGTSDDHVNKGQNLQSQPLQGSCRASGESWYSGMKMYSWKGGLCVPQGKPRPRHPLVGHLRTQRPTVAPGGWLASCCWGRNPFSPALCPGKAVRGKCHGVKEDIWSFHACLTELLAKAENDRSQFREDSLLDWWDPFLRASRKAPPT